MMKVEFCTLDSYETREEGFIDIFRISKQRLKKDLSHKELKKRMKKGEVMSVAIDIVNHDKTPNAYEGAEVEILFENEFFLAVNKPIKVHTVAQRYQDNNSLTAWLEGARKESFFKVNPKELNRGTLNRLDYETSGVVVYAASDDLYKNIRSVFSEYFLEKKYLCVVHGETKDQELLKQHLRPFGPKGSMVKVSDDGVGCELFYKKLAYENGYSLLEVSLVTGFRHQIRVQLASIGHPIVGDQVYGQDGEDQLYLHAFKYTVEHRHKVYEMKTRYPTRFLKFFNFNGEL
jgi:23S rRNA-/tRNA-specific pseudouridylate synthase